MDWRRLYTSRALLFWAGLGLAGLALPACAPTVLEAATLSVERRDIVRVTVEDVSHDVLAFKVHNLSKEPLTVMKSEIEVETPYGVIRHPPGTKAAVYEIAPGGKQTVHLKLTLKEMERGDPVEVHFDNAIRQRGHPVAMDPVLFHVKHANN